MAILSPESSTGGQGSCCAPKGSTSGRGSCCNSTVSVASLKNPDALVREASRSLASIKLHGGK